MQTFTNAVFLDTMLFVIFVQVGLIIGKGGETIKNLQKKSGARIQVARLCKCMEGM